MGVNTLLYRTSRLSSPPVSPFAPRILPLCFARQGLCPLAIPTKAQRALDRMIRVQGLLWPLPGVKGGGAPLLIIP